MSKDVEVKWNGDRAAFLLQAEIAEMLWLAGQDAITQSIDDVPLNTGTLRRSAVVTASKLPNAREVFNAAQGGYPDNIKPVAGCARVYVSYNTPYAVKLHESKDWKPRAWKKTAGGKIVAKPAVGTWKWLEMALPKVASRWEQYVARARKKVGL